MTFNASASAYSRFIFRYLEMTQRDRISAISTYKAMQEPALLLIILRGLQQSDLLRAQRVCRIWRATIFSSKELSSILFLHPGPPVSTVPERTGAMSETPTPENCPSTVVTNSLLAKAFPSFFTSNILKNDYTKGCGNEGPWRDLGRFVAWTSHYPLDEDWQWEMRERFVYPNASWRKMLPCWPPPEELQVEMLCKDGNALNRKARLKLSNVGDNCATESHPPWLTFGLLYDLAENAWFQGRPYFIDSLQLRFQESKDDRLSSIVVLVLHVDLNSPEKRTVLHREAFAESMRRYERFWEEKKKKTFSPRFQLCGFRPSRPITPCIFMGTFISRRVLHSRTLSGMSLGSSLQPRHLLQLLFRQQDQEQDNLVEERAKIGLRLYCCAVFQS